MGAVPVIGESERNPTKGSCVVAVSAVLVGSGAHAIRHPKVFSASPS